MPRTRASSRSLQRFTPSPAPAADTVPGAARDRSVESSDDAGEIALPMVRFGAPPGRPPGATRGVPRLGGIAVPPEIRRRIPGAVRVPPEAVDAAERIRLALRKAQRKLIDAQQKLQSSVEVARAKLMARR